MVGRWQLAPVGSGKLGAVTSESSDKQPYVVQLPPQTQAVWGNFRDSGSCKPWCLPVLAPGSFEPSFFFLPLLAVNHRSGKAALGPRLTLLAPAHSKMRDSLLSFVLDLGGGTNFAVYPHLLFFDDGTSTPFGNVQMFDISLGTRLSVSRNRLVCRPDTLFVWNTQLSLSV